MLGLSRGQQLPCSLDEVRKALRVELVGPKAQAVARRSGLHDVAVAERLAQSRDVYLHGLDRPRWRLLAPQRERQPLTADCFAGVHQQHCEDRARLEPTQDQSALFAVDFERSEDPKLHRARRTLPAAPRGCQRSTCKAFADRKPAVAGVLDAP